MVQLSFRSYGQKNYRFYSTRKVHMKLTHKGLLRWHNEDFVPVKAGGRKN
jgi:hypothetical protein